MGLKETLDALFHEMSNPCVIILSLVFTFLVMKLAFRDSSNKK